MSSELIPDSKPNVKKSRPAEMRTYRVLCDSCEGIYQTVLLSGPHDSGSEHEFAALRQAERLGKNHCYLYPGHRTFVLMDTHNTLVETSIHVRDEVEFGR